MALQGCLQVEELPGGPCGIHLWMSGDFFGICSDRRRVQRAGKGGGSSLGLPGKLIHGSWGQLCPCHGDRGHPAVPQTPGLGEGSRNLWKFLPFLRLSLAWSLGNAQRIGLDGTIWVCTPRVIPRSVEEPLGTRTVGSVGGKNWNLGGL